MNRSITMAPALIAAALTATSAVADTRLVPDEYPTIQAAIDAAADGDEIILANGTYADEGNKNVVFLGKTLTLRSQSGDRDACVIDCEDDGRFAKLADGDEVVIRSLTIQNGNVGTGSGGAALITGDTDTTFEDCIVQDCDAASGGALWIENGSLTSSDGSVFRNNVAAETGGAICAESTSISLVDTTFDDNEASSDSGGAGGAVYCRTSVLTIDGCSFDGNSAPLSIGGAVDAINGELTCTDSSFTDNVAIGAAGMRVSSPDEVILISGCRFMNNECPGQGGGLGIVNPGEFYQISSCLFEGNMAGGSGGGLVLFAGDATSRVQDCVFLANTAQYGGGAGVGQGDPASPTFVNCLFALNTATSRDKGFPAYSGAVDIYGAGTPTFVNCTLTGNTSDDFGGAICALAGGHPEFVGCVLWGNDAPTGEEIHVADPLEPGSVTVSYSNVAGGEAGVTSDGATVVWGDGNIDADPLFVDPDTDDYRLLAGSPCIDAADNTAVPEDVTDDIDGRPRFVDDPDTVDTGLGDAPIADMGAHEFQTCAADIDRDESVGFGDLVAVLAAWGPYEPCPPAIPEDMDHDCEVGFADLLTVLATWGSCR